MERFDETVNIQPQDVRTGGVQASLSFADQMRQWSETAANMHRQQVIQRETARGAADAQQAAQGDQSIAMENPNFFGRVGKEAYNAALRNGYASSIAKDNAEDVQRLALEHESDLKGFNDKVSARIQALTKSVDPSLSGLAAATMDSMANGYRKKIIENEHNLTLQRAYAEAQGGVDGVRNVALDFARDINLEATGEQLGIAQALLATMVDSGQLTAKDARSQYDALVMDTEKAKLSGLIDRTVEGQGLDAGYDQLIELEGARPSNVEPEDWDGFLTKEQSRLDRKRAILERDLAQKKVAEQKALDFSKVQQRIEGNESIVIEPAIADAYYKERIMPAVAGLDVESRQAVEANFVNSLKMMPRTMRAQIENNIGSRNVDLIAESARLLDRVDEIPGIVETVNSNARAYADKVVTLAQTMDPEEAVQLAQKATDPKDKARIEAAKQFLDDRFRGENRQEFYRDSAQSAFASRWPLSTPDVDPLNSARMAKEWGELYESHVLAGQDESRASDLASKTIKRVWGKSSIINDQVMKYPPENYYEPDADGSFDWIKTQLVRDLNADSFGFEIAPENIFLVSSEQTARLASTGRPAYSVKFLTPEGWQTAANSWAPDVEAEQAKRKARTIKDAEALRRSKIVGDSGLTAEQNQKLQKVGF